MNESERHHNESVTIEKIRSGDASAFKILFDKYSTPLLDFALTLVQDTQTAENIVQNVFIRIWKNRDNLNSSHNMKAYLYKAVRNQGFQHIRDRKLSVDLEIADTEESILPTPEEELQEKELKIAVNSAVNELPDGCRIVFTLNRYDGFSYKEIAEILDISVNTVKTQMTRAFKYLRSRLSIFLTLLHF